MKLLTEQEVELLSRHEDQLTGDPLKQYVYSKGWYDTDFFIRYFLSEHMKHPVTGDTVGRADFHKEIDKVFDDGKNAVLICPIGHAKTSTCRFNFIKHMCYGFKKELGIIMADSNGKREMKTIRNVFQNNEAIKSIFGDLVPSKKKSEDISSWSAREFNLKNGVMVDRYTFGSTIRGARKDIIWGDDPQDEKDVKNPLICKEFHRWYMSAVFGRLKPGGFIVTVGTIINPMCLVNMMSEKNRDTNKIIKYKCVEDAVFEMKNGKKHIVSGKPLRPEYRPIEQINKKLQQVGRDVWNQEYMHIPMLGSSVPFFKKNLTNVLEPFALSQHKNYYDDKYEGLSVYRSAFDDETEELIPCVMGIDIAEGGVKGDYSAIVLRDYNYNLLATYYGKVPPHVLCEVVDYLINERGFAVDRNKLGSEINATPGGMFIESSKKYDRYKLIYERETVDKIVNKTTGKKGRQTNTKTRRLILENIKKIFEDGSLDEFDDRQIVEMQNFAFNSKNKPEAISPYHDDLVMADAICCWLISKPKKEYFSIAI